MSNHTPGPWKVSTFNHATGQEDGISEYIISEVGKNIIPSGVFIGSEENLANAHLIASAPEMLESIKELLEIYKRDAKNSLGSQNVQVILHNAEDAIAKATGQVAKT